MAAPPGTPGPRAIALVGMASLALAMGVGRFLLTPLIPLMRQDRGLSLTAAAWLASANHLGYLIGALSAARLAIGEAKAVRWSLVGVGLATLAMGLSSATWVWLLSRFIAGVMSAWVLVNVSSWSLGRLASAGAAHLSGVVYAGVGFGTFATGVIAAWWAGQRGDAGSAWVGFSILTLAVILVLWKPLRTDAPSASRRPTPVSASGTAEARRLVVAYGTFGFAYIIAGTFLPTMARSVMGEGGYAWFWPLFGLAALLSTLAAAQMGARWGDRRVLAASLGVMACGNVSAATVPGGWGLAAGAVMVGGTFMVATMVGLREGRRIAGDAALPLLGRMTAAFAVGQILGPIVSGYLTTWCGSFSPSLLLAAALLLGGIVLLSASERRNADASRG